MVEMATVDRCRLGVFSRIVLTGVFVLTSAPQPSWGGQEGIVGAASEVKSSLLVFAHEANSTAWSFIDLNVNSGETRSIMQVKREGAWDNCGFALVRDTLVVFFTGTTLEIWNLTSVKRSMSFQVFGNPLYTLAFNPDTDHIEGVCQWQVPDQNFTETSWCYLGDSGYPQLLHSMAMDVNYFGHVRSDCVSFIDSSGLTFWYPGVENEEPEVKTYFAGVSTAVNASSGNWTWFGVTNSSVGLDAYFRDEALKRSFCIQLAPGNKTSQLVEIMPGKQPPRPGDQDHSPPPRLLLVLPDELVLCIAGLAAYDQHSHTIHAIMEQQQHSGSAPGRRPAVRSDAQHLVSIDVLKLHVTAVREIKWPTASAGRSLESVQLWSQASKPPALGHSRTLPL